MINDLKAIKPGVGLGDITFGMSREEIKNMLGEPTEKETLPFRHEEDDESENWHYDELELSLGFDEESDWKLSMISVTSSLYELKNKKIIGLSMDDTRKILDDLGIKDTFYEDLSTDGEESLEVVTSDTLATNFWFEDKILVEIQWESIYEDNNAIGWPNE